MTITPRPDNSPTYVRDIAIELMRLSDRMRPKPVYVSDNYTVAAPGILLLVDASAGDIDITLPDPKPYAHDAIMMVRTDNSINTVNVIADSINGLSSIQLQNNYVLITVISTGTEWIGG